MLRSNVLARRVARAFLRPTNSSYEACRMSTAVKKSWIPVQEELLQKMATQSLIHEMSIQANESAAIVVPWFLHTMPVSTTHFLISTATYHFLLQCRDLFPVRRASSQFFNMVMMSSQR